MKYLQKRQQEVTEMSNAAPSAWYAPATQHQCKLLNQAWEERILQIVSRHFGDMHQAWVEVLIKSLTIFTLTVRQKSGGIFLNVDFGKIKILKIQWDYW